MYSYVMMGTVYLNSFNMQMPCISAMIWSFNTRLISIAIYNHSKKLKSNNEKVTTPLAAFRGCGTLPGHTFLGGRCVNTSLSFFSLLWFQFLSFAFLSTHYYS